MTPGAVIAALLAEPVSPPDPLVDVADDWPDEPRVWRV